MPRQATIQNKFTFLKGLYTDGGPLLPVEDTSSELVNVDLDTDGSLTKRKGLTMNKFETTYFGTHVPAISTTSSLFTTSNSRVATAKGVWKLEGLTQISDVGSVAGPHGLHVGTWAEDIEVVQVGKYIFLLHKSDMLRNPTEPLTHVYPIMHNTPTIGALNYVIDLEEYALDASVDDYMNNPVTINSGQGRCFIASKYIQPLMIEMSEDFFPASPNSRVVVSTLGVLTRDLEGNPTGQIAYRPTGVDPAHIYNLQNNGWYAYPTDYVAAYITAKGTYPSTAEVAWSGFYVDPATGKKAWDATEVEYSSSGGAAPKGYMFVNPLKASKGYHPKWMFDILSAQRLTTSTTEFTTSVNHGMNINDTVVLFDNLMSIGSEQTLGFTGEWRVSAVPTSTTFVVTHTARPTATGAYTIHRPGWGYEVTSAAAGTRTSEIDSDYAYSAIALYASRVWYAGTDTTHGRLYFSQVGVTTDKYVRCYSKEDPTAEDSAGLLADDGGYIVIPELGEVHSMHNLGDKLIVLSTKGVWQIGGDGDDSFKATAYSVSKLSTYNCIAPAATIEYENTLYFWTRQGICMLRKDETGRNYQVISITEERLDNFLSTIPKTNLLYIQGDYNDAENTIEWLYNKDTVTHHRNKKDILVYNTRLDAFYTYTIGDVATDATDVGQAVSAIIIPDGEPSTGNPDHKRMLLYTYSQSTGTVDNIQYASFTDDVTWADTLAAEGSTDSVTPVDSYVITGYDHQNNPSMDKQLPYIWVYMDNITGSECKLQARWSWDEGGFGKWSPEYNVFRTQPYNKDQSIMISKNKLRGEGKSIQLRFQGSDGKPMKLYGWTATYTANTGI